MCDSEGMPLKFVIFKSDIVAKERRMNAVEIAMICHGVNKAYCESIGDNSQPDWGNAPDWQRKSAINGVNNFLSAGGVTPEESHESWLREKEDDGWVHGEVKDPEKKTHPCMVPYGDLPKEQKTKDALFTAVVRTCDYLDKETYTFETVESVG